jgi:glutamine synthetase
MDTYNSPLKTFLSLPYSELEQRNLKAKRAQQTETPPALEKEYREYLSKEKSLKAVTLCFSDIEGKFQMLDYDKNYLLKGAENLTFDGSSVRGYTVQRESDLRLIVDWGSIIWLPSDVFGPGKVMMFAYVANRDRTMYPSDFRWLLRDYTKKLSQTKGLRAYVSTEIEGIVVDGVNAEQTYTKERGFTLVSTGGYYHVLPKDRLRLFIDAAAEAQRAMGFENEKDHPEVAPSQFELNFSYCDINRIADQVQLYKLVCRQVAASMGMTATFLPKPMVGINGSGMHTNMSVFKNTKNVFYDAHGDEGVSSLTWDFISRILHHAPELCLLLNPSVNAYRRLDPHFEAPNQIKVSANDRGAMIRIPAGNERTARIEVRSVSPDVNPYLVFYALLRTGLEGRKLAVVKNKRERVRFLPGDIYDAMRSYKAGEFISKILGEENKEKYLYWKEQAAGRSPRELGTFVKNGEVLFHHEVTNQWIWRGF